MKVYDAFITLSALLYAGVIQIDAVDVHIEAQSDEGSVRCNLYEVNGMPTFPRRSEILRIHCLTEAGETFRVINISDDLSDEIRSGQAQILVPLSSVLDGIIDLSTFEGDLLQYQNMRYPRIDRKGIFRLAVIRVTDINGLSPDKNAAQLSNDIFGTDGDPANLVSGYDECSGGKVKWIPGVGPNIRDGVLDLALKQSVAGQTSNQVESWVSGALRKKSGWNEGNHTHVMYVLPEKVNFQGNAAYAYIGWSRSVFWNKYASIHLVLMHEIGHNFGHHHSGEGDLHYGDGTCMMGAHTYDNDTPHSCFNAAKSWQFGWYSDRHMNVIPTSSNFQGKLISIDDYVKKKANANDQKSIIRVKASGEKDLFLIYNRAKGINADVPAHRNQVTVVEQIADGQPSWVKKALSAGDTYFVTNWSRSGKRLIIKVCDIVTGVPDYASVIIYLENQNDLRCDSDPSPAPTQQIPSSAPQKGPIHTSCVNPRDNRMEFFINNDLAGLRYVVKVQEYGKYKKILRKDLKADMQYRKNKCLKKNACYKFVIRDKRQQNRIESDGHYKLYWNGKHYILGGCMHNIRSCIVFDTG